MMSEITSFPVSSSEAARRRDRDYVWHTWSPINADRAELMLSEGVGYRVRDVDGKEYLDASSLHSSCGFADPNIIDAVTAQMRRIHHFDLSVGSHEPAGLLAERIAVLLPEGLSRTLFVNSGSEGFEAAVMIASAYWSHVGEARSRIVTFSRGYHGSTLISRSLSRLPRIGHAMSEPVPVTCVELPLPAHRLREPQALAPLLAAFEEAIGDDQDDLPMAVVVEPFLNVGGGVVLPTGFLRGLSELCHRTGTLLVLDEVFTGYGRLGSMFAFEPEDARPDVLVSSKGLASGYMPITAVTVDKRIYGLRLS